MAIDRIEEGAGREKVKLRVYPDGYSPLFLLFQNRKLKSTLPLVFATLHNYSGGCRPISLTLMRMKDGFTQICRARGRIKRLERNTMQRLQVRVLCVLFLFILKEKRAGGGTELTSLPRCVYSLPFGEPFTVKFPQTSKISSVWRVWRIEREYRQRGGAKPTQPELPFRVFFSLPLRRGPYQWHPCAKETLQISLHPGCTLPFQPCPGLLACANFFLFFPAHFSSFFLSFFIPFFPPSFSQRC